MLERIKLGMWKSSHIRLAKYLADKQEFSCLHDHRLGFFLGNILPDCIPSFITRRHRIQDTFFILKEELQKIESSSKVDFYFCLHLGIILHYVADYFTYLLQKPLGSPNESRDLIKYLLKKHNNYLEEGASIATDCRYVVEVCYTFAASAIYFSKVQIPLAANKRSFITYSPLDQNCIIT